MSPEWRGDLDDEAPGLANGPTAQCSLVQDIFRCSKHNILGSSSERYGCMLQSARLANMRWRLSASTEKEQVEIWPKTVGLDFKSGTSRVGHSANLLSVTLS